MLYYQEGHNKTIEGYQSAQTPCKIFYSLSCLLGRIYSTKLDIFIGSQRSGSTARSDISDPRSDISDLHRVPVPCHPSLIGYIRAASDISDPAEFEPV
jgi:hypothetical protein